MLEPAAAREFALQVVVALRAAGYEALWAGGCVRDLLLQKEPKDYDVATSATPNQVRDCLGHRRTLPIGASFGVITVVGPPQAGQVEVATFRRDADYTDGRRPSSVSFTSSEEDAKRRDFTINGLFYDPLAKQVIDYVGGQTDLQKKVIRAIGNPHERFTEDKLRLLRGVRFAATLGFALEEQTALATQAMAHTLPVVSAERIAAEMRRMLISNYRATAVRLLIENQLLTVILPGADILSVPDASAKRDRLFTRLEYLSLPRFEPALALILRELTIGEDKAWGAKLAQQVAILWRLSTEEGTGTAFCLAQEQTVIQSEHLPWPLVQRVLIQPRVPELIAYVAALTSCEAPPESEQGLAFCQQKLSLPPEVLSPAPLLDGAVLQKLGLRPGPLFREILEKIRDAQLLGELTTTDEAVAWTLNYVGDKK